MGSLFSTLDIARSGLQVAQIQLDVAGHNIANVNKTGYSRQRVELASRQPQLFSFGQLGRGVGVANIVRIRDEFLDKVYRQQVQSQGSATAQAQYYKLIEDAFLEPSDNGFGQRLNTFFDAMSTLANNVEEIPVREAAISEAGALASAMNDMAGRFYALRTNANEEVRNQVPQINSIATQIADLNTQIRDAELTGRTANDLRDDRGVLLDELAKIVSISYTERENGQVDVLLGSNMLVDGSTTRTLAAVPDSTLDPQRGDLLQVRFTDTNIRAEITGGSLYGALTIRDGTLVQVSNRVDRIAATIIQQVNRIHSQANGLQNISGNITGSNAVTNSGTALASAGLPFSLTAGSFDVLVYDASGAATTTTVNVTATTTLSDLAASLSAIPNFSASVTGENKLQLGAASPYTYSFANDTSGVLTALGVNGLFNGQDARSMKVNPDILANPARLSTGYSANVLDTGDNFAAQDIANVRNGLFIDSNTSSINDYYQSTIAQIGVDARANDQQGAVINSFINDFESRRQEASGVSIDEEVTFLMQCQRAYEACARVITVTDRMLDALMAAGA